MHWFSTDFAGTVSSFESLLTPPSVAGFHKHIFYSKAKPWCIDKSYGIWLQDETAPTGNFHCSPSAPIGFFADSRGSLIYPQEKELRAAQKDETSLKGEKQPLQITRLF